MGSNDIHIITAIVSILVLTAIFTPMVYNIYGLTSTAYDTTGVTNHNSANTGTLTASQNFTIVLGVLLWDFSGLIPTWLNFILMMLKIVLILVIARNVWIGGGG